MSDSKDTRRDVFVSGPAAASAPEEVISMKNEFAFLIHSKHTLPLNLPPNVDNKSLARQRRRRTSPEDQAVLEAEFRKDPKPGKESRRSIVDRVALGEKEVQIWFQNRRQTSRRRSRPSMLEEVPSHAAAESRESPSSATAVRSGIGQHCSKRNSWEAESDDLAELPTLSNIVTIEKRKEMGKLSPTPDGTGRLVRDGIEEHKLNGARQGRSNLGKPSPTHASPCGSEVIPNENIEQGKDRLCLAHERGSTKGALGVRLSLTSEGSARLLQDNESSPSPPRPKTLPPLPLSTRSLRRSFSATGLDRHTHDSAKSPNGMRDRLPIGHSRDSRAWEFWCDSDARNQLSVKAELEHTGSAAGAISLLRSSGRAALAPINGLAESAQGSSSRKRIKSNPRRNPVPALGKSQSSVGRLQGSQDPPFQLYEDDRPHGTALAESTSCAPWPSGESDKENQDPRGDEAGQLGFPSKESLDETNKSPQRMQGKQASFKSGNRRERALTASKQHSGLPLAGGRRKATAADPDEENEMRRFMTDGRRVREEGCGAEEEDLDCVQGLLSLSQGNWK